MAEIKTAFKEGLEDVVATSSGICYIDGDKGILSYRGYNIHDLAGHSCYEETAHLLWFGSLPTASDLERTRRQMAANRSLPRQVLDFLWGSPKDSLPMDVLRTAVSMLAHYDPDSRTNSPDANQRKAYRLAAALRGQSQHPRLRKRSGSKTSRATAASSIRTDSVRGTATVS